MLIAALLLGGLQAAPVPARPGPLAITLGERLARAGTLAALLPLALGKEVDDLVKAHPELSPADQATLRRVALATARPRIDRLLATEGAHYAEVLSEAELVQLVAQAESPAGRRQREVLPYVIAGTMAEMEEVHLKEEVSAAFCRETGKLCVGAAPR